MTTNTSSAMLTAGGLTVKTAMSGSVATNPGSAWFQSLEKPSWQPPPALFPIVWTALYTAIAWSSGRALQDLGARGEKAEADALMRALTVNLALNESWSWIFFRGHGLRSSIAVAAALTVSSIDLVRRVGSTKPVRAIALAPYAAWCGFATALTAAIWRRNR